MLTLGIHNVKSVPGWLDVAMKNNKNIAMQGIRGRRSLGSSAIDSCFVACGGSDAYLEYGIHCWDVAAAALIVKEAGGCVIDPTGGPFDLMSRRFLIAGTEKLARAIVPIIENVDFPPD